MPEFRASIRHIAVKGIDIVAAHKVFESWSRYGRTSFDWWKVCFSSPVSMKAKISYTEPFRDEPARSRSFDSTIDLSYCGREGALFCRFQQSDDEPLKLFYTWYGAGDALSPVSNVHSVLLNYIIECLESELKKRCSNSKFEIEERAISSISYPSSADFADAVQVPSASFRDAELQACVPVLDSLGLPVAASGNFATVFRLAEQNSDWAVRCFNAAVSDEAKHYAAIDHYFREKRLNCLLPFEFLADGLLVRGRRYPIIKMRWVAGETLDCFVSKHRKNCLQLSVLRARFRDAASELQEHGIVHGDLQHGNIIVSEEHGLTFVDYDAVCVPGLERGAMPELGHRNYQHPQRRAHHLGPYLDNFSAWLIDLSLHCLSLDPFLWEYWKGDECLLFRKEDFVSPSESKLVDAMKNHALPEIVTSVEQLLSFAAMPIELVPTLGTTNELQLDAFFRTETEAQKQLQ